MKSTSDLKFSDSSSVNTADDVESITKEIMDLLNEKKDILDMSIIEHLESFKTLSIAHKKNNLVANRSILDKLLTNWDIMLLMLLNLIFAFLLVFFTFSYMAPKSNVSIILYEFNERAYKFVAEQWLLNVNGAPDVTNEQCLLEMPSFSNAIFRPVDNCQMCQGLTEIKRIANISKAEFLENYAYTAVPVIITGTFLNQLLNFKQKMYLKFIFFSDAMTNWTAMSEMNFDFLRELYKKSDEVAYRKRQSKNNSKKDSQLASIISTFKSIVETDEIRSEEKDTCQFFPYKTNFKNLRQVFDMDYKNFDQPWLE